MKKVLNFLFVVLPLIAIGQGTKAKSFSHTIQLQAAPEYVWNAITDFSNFSLWDNNVVDVSCPDDLARKKSCKVIVKTGKIVDVEIIELIENESYTVRHKLSSGNIYIKRSLNAGSNLELTETVWYAGLSKRTFEKYKGADYKTIQKNRMLEFKKYFEEDVAHGR